MLKNSLMARVCFVPSAGIHPVHQECKPLSGVLMQVSLGKGLPKTGN
jgi:hypothetical protein